MDLSEILSDTIDQPDKIENRKGQFVNVRIPRDIFDMLDGFSRHFKKSKTDLVAEILGDFVKNVEPVLEGRTLSAEVASIRAFLENQIKIVDQLIEVMAKKEAKE